MILTDHLLKIIDSQMPNKTCCIKMCCTRSDINTTKEHLFW